MAFIWLLFPHSISSTQSISNVLALKCTVPLQRANQLYSILFCLVEDTEPAVCGVLTGPGSPLCLLPFGWLPPPAHGWHLVDPHRSPWPSQSTDMIKTWFSFQCKQRTASSNQRLYIKEANACILWFGQQDLWKCHWSHYKWMAVNTERSAKVIPTNWLKHFGWFKLLVKKNNCKKM